MTVLLQFTVLLCLAFVMVTPLHVPPKTFTRRALLSSTSILPITIATLASADSGIQDKTEYQSLIASRKIMEKLLEDWQDLTVSCLYADIPRDLLEQKNKEQLLKEASTFALFDKSASVQSCKESNSKIRQYLGIYKDSGSALVGLDKKFKRLKDVYVNDDDEERWFDLVDEFNVRLSKIDTLTYQTTLLSQTTVGYDLNGDSKIDGSYISNPDLVSAKEDTQAALSILNSIIAILPSN